MQHNPITDQKLDEIEARATARRAALSGWINCYSPLSEQEALENAEAVLKEDVPALLAEVRRLRDEVNATRTKTLAVEADAIVAHCPDHGSKDGVWMDCHCAVADDMRRRASAPAPAVSGGEQ